MVQVNDESLKTTLVTYNSVVKAAAVVKSYGWQQALDILKEMEDVQLKEAWCFNIQPTDVVCDWDLWHPKPSQGTAIAGNKNYSVVYYYTIIYLRIPQIYLHQFSFGIKLLLEECLAVRHPKPTKTVHF